MIGHASENPRAERSFPQSGRVAEGESYSRGALREKKRKGEHTLKEGKSILNGLPGGQMQAFSNSGIVEAHHLPERINTGGEKKEENQRQGREVLLSRKALRARDLFRQGRRGNVKREESGGTCREGFALKAF